MQTMTQHRTHSVHSKVSLDSPKSLELFAGGGGMALGLHIAGFRHSALVEFEQKACDTLVHNAIGWRQRNGCTAPWTPESVHLMDVRDFNPFDDPARPPIDLLAGGPPCQPFSLGGVHAGENDARNMFPAALELVRQVRPKLVLFENVAGLLRPSFLPYFEYVEQQLRSIAQVSRSDEAWTQHHERLVSTHPAEPGDGYHVTRQLVNAADYGVPQSRRRVMLMAVRNDLAGPIPQLDGTHSEEALLRDQYATGGYWDRHGLDAPCAKTDPRLLERAASTECPKRPWRTVRDAILGLPAPVDGESYPGILNHVGIPGAKSYPGHTGSDIDRPSKTIKAGVHGVCGGEAMIRYPDGALRYMTVREAARIQTFPDDYEFVGARSHAMRHIGNAVPVHLAAVFGRHMLDHLAL